MGSESAIPDYADLLRLDGKGMVMLGAGQGIGRQVSHALAQMGAQLVCVDIDAGCAAEAALHHLARCAAVEYGPRGVRVNTVAPGTTRTARLMELMGDSWDALEATVPLRRSALPADIASVVLFLSSALAVHVTAQIIVVDGGVTATVTRPAFPSRRSGGEGGGSRQ